MAQRTILVADDDASIRSLLKQLLSDEGYNVVEATTGSEVVEKVKDVNPDLVIMDVRMPELDGIEALSKLKVSSPKTSVLIMTAFGSSNNAIRAMELGAFDYITKPFELDKISHTVKRVIEYRDLTSEVQVLRDEISSLVQTERIVGNSPADLRLSLQFRLRLQRPRRHLHSAGSHRPRRPRPGPLPLSHRRQRHCLQSVFCG